ncbi:MAG TPA: hypothetical protein EYP56_21320 [Planctomycetaceae bacterium]|nr:hypothetical protein [Planctomycetaceae bacterium]
MTPRAFLNHFAAVIEELLDRYLATGPAPPECPEVVQALIEGLRQRYADGALPLERNGDDYDLERDLLGPLVLGRALCPGGKECTKREASYRIRPRDLTLTRPPWSEYLSRYESNFVSPGLIDEQAIRTIRGVAASEDQA